MLLRERGYRDERDTEPVLIEVRTRLRVRPGRREARTRREGVVHALAAIGASSGAFTRRRVRQVRALSRRDAVGSALAMLPRRRRRHMIVASAVLVVCDDDDRVLPERAVANGSDVLCDEILSPADAVRRRLVALLRG